MIKIKTFLTINIFANTVELKKLPIHLQVTKGLYDMKIKYMHF